jgi:hypothetical protein
MKRPGRHNAFEFLFEAIDRGVVRSAKPIELLREQVLAEYGLWWKPIAREYKSRQAFLAASHIIWVDRR